MIFLTPEIKMSADEFRLLRDFVYQHCGLNFTEDSKYLLEKRLGKRLQQHNLKTFKDYYYFLRYNPNKDQELSEVIDQLTTNETYFYREDFQLKTFVQDILPEIRRRKEQEGRQTLRIWSAGCSSGEEPYTIAMLLLGQPWLKSWRVEVIGTDISQRVLHMAREGIYGEASFRSTDPLQKMRFFSDHEGKSRINDEVRNLVSISYLNLFDTARIGLLGKMDVVFCRNVIIYFDKAGKKSVIENFFQRLVPDGFLLLGHSESLINLSTSFQLRHFQHDMVYQKPVSASAVAGSSLMNPGKVI
ncbi:MAG: protein-glutamate O-methyltransferase CheR [Deltaproteobacteria bacterium]|nr:MAG: protein-glutamate O-methyltransferase CheR [Deltaproteobacteria bacterium]